MRHGTMLHPIGFIIALLPFATLWTLQAAIGQARAQHRENRKFYPALFGSKKETRT